MRLQIECYDVKTSKLFNERFHHIAAIVDHFLIFSFAEKGHEHGYLSRVRVGSWAAVIKKTE